VVPVSGSRAGHFRCWSARAAWPRPPPNGGSSSAGARNTDTPSRRTGPDASSRALRPGWPKA